MLKTVRNKKLYLVRQFLFDFLIIKKLKKERKKEKERKTTHPGCDG
jgi:hypothetical protein